MTEISLLFWQGASDALAGALAQCFPEAEVKLSLTPGNLEKDATLVADVVLSRGNRLLFSGEAHLALCEMIGRAIQAAVQSVGPLEASGFFRSRIAPGAGPSSAHARARLGMELEAFGFRADKLLADLAAQRLAAGRAPATPL